MRSLNLDHLRALTTVVKFGSFSAAARHLRLTQPGRQPADPRPGRAGRAAPDRPRRQEGARHRGGRGLDRPRGADDGRGRPRPDGDARSPRRSRRARSSRDRSDRTRLHPAADLQRLRDHPESSRSSPPARPTSITERLLENALDLGLTALPVDAEKFDVVPIRDDEMVAIFAATSSDIPAVVRPADVAGRALILEYHRDNRGPVDRAWLKDGGVEVRPALQFDEIEPIKDAVASGLGMAIVPRPAFAGGHASRSIVARSLDATAPRDARPGRAAARSARRSGARGCPRGLAQARRCARRSRLRVGGAPRAAIDRAVILPGPAHFVCMPDLGAGSSRAILLGRPGAALRENAHDRPDRRRPCCSRHGRATNRAAASASAPARPSPRRSCRATPSETVISRQAPAWFGCSAIVERHTSMVSS